jgi:hypothetical protein
MTRRTTRSLAAQGAGVPGSGGGAGRVRAPEMQKDKRARGGRGESHPQVSAAAPGIQVGSCRGKIGIGVQMEAGNKAL